MILTWKTDVITYLDYTTNPVIDSKRLDTDHVFLKIKIYETWPIWLGESRHSFKTTSQGLN